MRRKIEPKTSVSMQYGKINIEQNTEGEKPMYRQCAGERTRKNCKRGGARVECIAKLERTSKKEFGRFSKKDKKEYAHLLELLQRARKNMSELELHLAKLNDKKVS